MKMDFKTRKSKWLREKKKENKKGRKENDKNQGKQRSWNFTLEYEKNIG